MKILSCSIQNFGSYKSLDFDFQNQGLTLIQGATGSGKSTLCDVVPWILFGITSKGGKVDEIRPWSSQGTTSGTIRLSNNMCITRSRFPNDLWFSVVGNGCSNSYSLDAIQNIRGKDLGDTQKIINEKLGFDADLYLSGAYFHEFSQTAQFFTTSAKVRREICEQIVDLSLPTQLQVRTSETTKVLNKQLSEITNKITMLKSNLSILQRMESLEKNKHQDWQQNHLRCLQRVNQAFDAFENNRKQTHSEKCSKCGTVFKEPHEVYDDSPNPHTLSKETLLKDQNPHSNSMKDFSKEIEEILALISSCESRKQEIVAETGDLDILRDVFTSFRSELIRNTISFVESTTNQLLTKHFDAEILLALTTRDDKLDVEIQKDGNTAVYTQLSKGQRQLLKLCFAVSIMKSVQNYHSVSFEEIFMDEAMDGMDETLKTKAYDLLEELATVHSSVFVVEHSEGLKALFPNSYKVTLVNGESVCQA